jgi:DNA-binding cell septation regulator SpoVG
MTIAITNARKVTKGSLLGFFDVTLDSGLKLNGCQLFEKAGDDGVLKRWVGLPSREWTKPDGSKSYVPIVEIPDRGARDKFTMAVLPAAERALL